MEILKEPKPEIISLPCKGDKLTILGKQKPKNIVQERDSLLIPGNERPELLSEYIDELLIKSEEKPENEIQLIDQMEILREAKPVQISKIDKKDKFTIPGTAKQKSPLAIEYLDYLTITVDQNWRAQNKMKKCEVSQRDGLEIPAMERIPTQWMNCSLKVKKSQKMKYN